jgi:alkylation response protein AidB-like acyl-CoA dehydrogenase
MAELGFAGVLIPEEFGGSGFGYVGLGQVLEAQGRTIAASPLLSTAMVGASALIMAGSQAQKEAWLPKIASGEALTALAVDESAHHDPAHIKLAAKKSGAGFTLSGDKRYVVDGGDADLLIVAARTSGDAGDATGDHAVPRAGGRQRRDADGAEDAGCAWRGEHLVRGALRLALTLCLVRVDAGYATLEAILDRARIGACG